MGNLRSVEKALKKVGGDVLVTSNPDHLEQAEAVVLPGVGAFRDCIKNLQQRGLLEGVLEAIHEGKPYLGICLGLQILFTESEEFGYTRGLDVIRGRVVRFRTEGLKIPQMGWNTVSYRREHPLFAGIPDGSYFYFVHSYYVVPEDDDVVLGTTDYGVEFVSAVQKGNIMAVQFHPEKSQSLGLQMLGNFCRLLKESSLIRG